MMAVPMNSCAACWVPRHGRRVHDRALGSGCAQRLAETVEALWLGDPHAGMRGSRLRSGKKKKKKTPKTSVDTVDLIVWGMAAGGVRRWYAERLRQKPPEDLTRRIFPDEM